jgi:diacylglycerol kinase family enzyme
VVIQKALSADHDVRSAETSRRGHASRLAQGAAAEGLDVVVVLGGDGTINEAANGLVGSSTALGVLPGGSTNVFARTIGMTNDPVEATGELLAALAAGEIETVQLGQVNGRYFLFHLGAGFDAAVVAEVEKRAAVKRYLGSAMFVASAASTWAVGVDRRHPWFTLRHPPATDGGPPTEADDGIDGLFAICLNTGPYTFLGSRPLDLLPGLRLGAYGHRGDGHRGDRHGTDRPGRGGDRQEPGGLGVIVFDGISLRTLLGVTITALRGRTDPLSRSRHVWAERGAREVELVANRPLPYQVDGDYLGEADRLVVRCVPDALRLVLPLTSP